MSIHFEPGYKTTYSEEQVRVREDMAYASSYAWGRSDQGANLDANDIYRFAQQWQEKKRAFRAHETSHCDSLQSFYDEFFKDKKHS
jgi:hypothetical protein